MWNDISGAWQIAFKEAWQAFCAGSTPIGAVLCDLQGKVISSDHNRSNEPQTVNKRIAHAEANVLRSLDTFVLEPKTLTLYTTMEPCPMCMGTILMSDIRKLRFAAADTYCGMTHLLMSEPYYSSKNISCIFEGGELEQVQITIQAYYELKFTEQGKGGQVLEKFAEHCPTAVETAKRLYETRWLDKAADSGEDISEVFDYITNALGRFC